MSNLFPNYSKWEIHPDHAEGCYLYDTDGKKYLDFTSGIGVSNLGHCPAPVEAAVQEQLKKFWHVSNLFPVGIQEEAATKLARAAEMDCVFFANSGAEANEGAIKLARKATGRTKIITFVHSFHGRTFATMAATGQDKIKHGFGPMLETFTYVPFNDIEALKAELDSETAAVMLEIIQGEGGIYLAEEAFLKETAELCRQAGALLIIDEIQTGIGRTGQPFAYQHFGLKPDIVTSAKGLGSGFPIGAVIGTRELREVFGPGSHGSTFGGNPIAVAAANATLEVIFANSFLTEVQEKGEYFTTKLADAILPLEMVEEIRGKGLMIGIAINIPVAPVLAKLRENGFIALPAGDNVIRLLPPLTVEKAQLDEAVEKISNVLNFFLKTAV